MTSSIIRCDRREIFTDGSSIGMFVTSLAIFQASLGVSERDFKVSG